MSALRRPVRTAAVVVAAAVAGIALALLASSDRAAAQVPPTEEQALQVERQLLCPICTNERLDVCSTAICRDMKRIIRERLEAGSSPDDIILYFETRYGPKVRAQLEPEGFNLWLYGWIGVSTLVVVALGGWFLLRLRQRARPGPARTSVTPAASPDDAWLDAQIAADDDRT